MSQQDAIDQIQECAKEIALQLMKIHPTVGNLGNEEVQSIVLGSLHKMTVELEVVKKHLIVLQKRDDSTEL